MHDDTEARLDALQGEIESTRKNEARAEKDLQRFRIMREALERAFTLVAGRPPSGSPRSTASPSSPRRRGRRSEEVTRRLDAMRQVLSAQGPMGPTDLHKAVKEALEGQPVTPTQITDLLRRTKSEFASLGDGLWGLATAKANGQQLIHSPEGRSDMP